MGDTLRFLLLKSCRSAEGRVQGCIRVLSKDLWLYHRVIAVIHFIAMIVVNGCSKSFLFFFKKKFGHLIKLLM